MEKPTGTCGPERHPSRPEPSGAATPYCILLALLLAGCFTSREELSDRSPREWTRRDCLTVLISSTATNVRDNATSLWMIAVPYFPSVVEAIVRLDELADTAGTFDGTYRYRLDALLRSGSGLYYDWERGKYYSPRGHYFRDKTDIDSLLFLVTLINNGHPLYNPPLDTLEGRFALRNGRGEVLRPRFVSGKKNANLLWEERLFVMFDVAPPGREHFFEGQDYVWFEVNLPGSLIRSPFSLAHVD